MANNQVFSRANILKGMAEAVADEPSVTVALTAKDLERLLDAFDYSSLGFDERILFDALSDALSALSPKGSS